MNTQTKTKLKTLTRAGQRQNRVIAASYPITIRHPQHPSRVQQVPIIIDVPRRPVAEPVEAQTNTLSAYLERGRQMHPLCRHSFIERVELGYYHYERRTEWRTSAIAAAYAGAFGQCAVESPNLSYSQALWQLGRKLGYDITAVCVPGPSGRFQSLADEIVQLIDQDGWTRGGVAGWLFSMGW